MLHNQYNVSITDQNNGQNNEIKPQLSPSYKLEYPSTARKHISCLLKSDTYLESDGQTEKKNKKRRERWLVGKLCRWEILQKEGHDLNTVKLLSTVLNFIECLNETNH